MSLETRLLRKYFLCHRLMLNVVKFWGFFDLKPRIKTESQIYNCVMTFSLKIEKVRSVPRVLHHSFQNKPQNIFFYACVPSEFSSHKTRYTKNNTYISALLEVRGNGGYFLCTIIVTVVISSLKTMLCHPSNVYKTYRSVKHSLSHW